MIRHCDRCACETSAYGCWVCGGQTVPGEEPGDSRWVDEGRWDSASGATVDDLLDDEQETP